MNIDNYCTIYLIRHGQTDWNLEKRIQGRNPVVLNEMGRQQARAVSRALKSVKLSAIYASDIQRALETSQIIALDHDLTVIRSKLMRERAYGKLVGERDDILTDKLRKMIDKYYAIQDPDKRWRYRPMRGHESSEDVGRRTMRFLREVAAANIGKSVAVVTHGGIIKVVLAELGWVSKDEFYKVEVKNAGYVVIESDGTDFKIKDLMGINRNGAK